MALKCRGVGIHFAWDLRASGCRFCAADVAVSSVFALSVIAVDKGVQRALLLFNKALDGNGRGSRVTTRGDVIDRASCRQPGS